MNYIKFIFLFFFLTFAVQVFSSTPIILTDKHDVHDVRGIYIDYLEDSLNILSIHDIINSPLKHAFQTGKAQEVVVNKNFKSTYWIRIKIINNSSKDNNWVAELYDFRIENVTVFTHDNTGIAQISKGGAIYPFAKKNYQHKNFIYNLSIQSRDTLYLYYKIKADKQVSFIGRIRSYEKLLQYSNTEYFCLALFYGIMLAMIFYNFFLFLALVDVNYLYYVLYVASVGIYLLNNDGLGFQYLWPLHPLWNDSIVPIANFSMTIWALLHGRSFLSRSLKSRSWLRYGFDFIIILKTVSFVAWIYYPSLANIVWIDVIPFIYIYAIGIVAFISGNRMARFYVLAFTLFFTGFLISILRHFQLVPDNILTVYSFNIGILSEMILLSFALADRIKTITQEKENDLEEIVTERNKALDIKNMELDNFVYRSSHDIKGPIKSVIGLANLGVVEKDEEINKEYFNHILKSAKKLDEVVNHLLTVIEVKEAILNITKIDLQNSMQKAMKKVEANPGYEKIKIYLNIDSENEFYSDRFLFISAMENILEHCMTNADTGKMKSIIKINLEVLEGQLTINITENGLGINMDANETMTNMLYNMNIGTSVAGFALYKAKIYISKIHGSIKINSKKGIGTNIKINIKSQPIAELTGILKM